MNNDKKSISILVVLFTFIIFLFSVFKATSAAQTCTPQVLNPIFSTGDNMFTTLYGNDVVFSGGLAYTVSDYYGLRIVDVSDPVNPVVQNPTFTGSDYMGTTISGNGVFVSGSHAYVVSDSYGLRIVDVSDSANPFVTNPSFPLGSNMYTTQTGKAVYVSASLGLAYVVSTDYGLRIVDVSDPANPVVLNPSFPAGSDMYTTQTGNGIYVSESLGLAYIVSTDYGLRIVDVSDPVHPFVLNPTYPAPNDMYTTLSGNGIYVSGSLAYVVSDEYGLRIVNVSGT